MATAAQCSSWYYTSPTLPRHRRHGLQRQQPPQAARRGRWPRLQVTAAAAAGGARAEDSIKAATDAKFFQPSDTRPIMLFDGVCNLCNGGVRLVREHDPNRSIRYVPLQSESGRKLLQRSYIKSEAVLRIMEYLNLPLPQLAIFKFVPLFVRDFAYDNVATTGTLCLADLKQKHVKYCELLPQDLDT